MLFSHLTWRFRVKSPLLPLVTQGPAMSANRKSVFLSDSSLSILGPLSSGRLNGIIEKYGYLIRTQELATIFSPIELDMLYQIAKEKAIHERELWRELPC